MKNSRFGLHELLYYGEAAGVLAAWAVGVAVLLAAGGSTEPVAEAEGYANVSLSGADREDAGRED